MVTRNSLVLGALLLVIGLAGQARAHHVGVFIPKDDDVSKNVKDIKFASQAGRFDVALTRFDDGIVHATMEKREKELPQGLEDGLRAAIRGNDVPGVELRLAAFLTFMTKDRVAQALLRLKSATLLPERRRAQARKFLDAAWRYYNLADFAVTALDPRAGVALRMGFEDAQTYLGGMMVDPMWAGAANAPRADPDDAKAGAVMTGMIETSERVVTRAAEAAGAGRARHVLPPR